MQKLRTIHVFGRLKELLGGNDTIQLCGDTMAVLWSGIFNQYGKAMKEEVAHMQFVVDYDNENVDVDHVQDKLGDIKDIYLYPAVEGSGKVGTIILGIVLIVVGIIALFGPGTQGLSPPAWATGIGLIVGGVIDIYTALNSPKAQAERAAVAEKASFVFNGATNVVEQGGAVPLVYGRFRTGSTVMSAGIDVEQLAAYSSPIGGNSAPNSKFGISDV